jgi:ABC-type transport system involved in multi-copper enzyme maturation permease subunit
MPLSAAPTVAWFRRHLSWSNSGQSWQERLAGLALLAAAGGILWFGSQLELAYQVLLWGLWGVAWALVLRRGLVKLFGPVLFYDLLRIARRNRYAVLRVGYAVFLLVTLLLVYLNFHEDAWRGEIQARQMAQFAESFFFTFMSIQFTTVCLLTPAYTAGAIAEEKERKTLEFLLATDLHNREIILSKQLSRLGNMALLILTGLPVLAMTQFLGGVEPNLVLIGFAATGLTMAGLGSLSTLCSVYARRPRNAIMLTYLTMLAYVGVTGMAYILSAALPDVAGFQVWSGPNSIRLQDVLDEVSVANPFMLVFWIGSTAATGRPLGTVVVDVFPRYALFYGVVTLVCTVWSVLRLRTVALRQASGPARAISRRGRWRRRVSVSDRPMVWKEVRIEPGLQLNWVGRIAVGLLVVVSFIPPVWIVLESWKDNDPTSLLSDLWASSWAINTWVRSVGTLVACLTLLGVAFRASGSVTGERDRQTLDSLLTSPLDTAEMLHGKWLGSILSVRWGWVWLGLIWGLAVVTGGMHFLALPLLVIAWFVFAAFLAALGLWFSVVSRTTLRANLWTLGAALGLSFGHWLPWITCCLPFQMFAGAEGLEHVGMFQGMALTPPVTLGWLAFHGDEFRGSGNETAELTGDAIVGLILWGTASAALLGATNARFRQMTNRAPLRPQRPPETLPPPPEGETALSVPPEEGKEVPPTDPPTS